MSDEYWTSLWAFGVSAQGLHLSERRYYLLTPVEFSALKKRYDASLGIKSAKGWKTRRAEALQSPRVQKANTIEEAMRLMHEERCRAR